MRIVVALAGVLGGLGVVGLAMANIPASQVKQTAAPRAETETPVAAVAFARPACSGRSSPEKAQAEIEGCFGQRRGQARAAETMRERRPEYFGKALLLGPAPAPVATSRGRAPT